MQKICGGAGGFLEYGNRRDGASDFCKGNGNMKVSYKKLWKLLIDKEMMKKDLQSQAGISWTSVTKLSKGENVGMEVLMKICTVLDCNIGDIVEFVKDKDSESDSGREGC